MDTGKIISLKDSLDAAFKPRSIAIIGASNGHRLGGAEMRLLIESGFKGAIYPVNPKEKMIQGYKAYPSVLDIPDHVDRASVIVSSKLVPKVVKECAQKGVRTVQIYSAGFGEFGEEGKLIEQEIVDMANKHEMRIIGPNCIGTYVPDQGLNFTKGASMISGNVSFISQSGGIAFDMVSRGKQLGLHFSKVISVGNCIDLDHPDYLEYLIDDDDTDIIAFYIESVKNGPRFMKLLKKAALKKTVMVLKGGRTGSGQQSVASHTGNLAGNYEIWDTLFEQTGVMPIKSIDEMLKSLLSIQRIRYFENQGMALIGNGGGASVLATDYLEESGLNLAKLSKQGIDELNKLGVADNLRNCNPIDMPANQIAEEEGKLFGKVIKVLNEENTIGYIIFHLNLIPILNYMDLKNILEKMIHELSSFDYSNTNLIGVLRYNGDPEVEKVRHEATKLLEEIGVPIFATIEDGIDSVKVVINK